MNKEAILRGFNKRAEQYKQAVEWDDPKGNIYHSQPLYYLNQDQPELWNKAMSGSLGG